MKINLGKMELSGKYRCIVSKDSECKQVVSDTGWFDNLILDNGLEILGQNDTITTLPDRDFQEEVIVAFHVGSGSDAPTVSDISLQNTIATQFIGTSSTYRTENSSYTDGYASVIYNRQFGEGAAEGNLSEIGVGPSDTNLFSRALIVDSNGDPTTITVLDNEFLTVYYELRVNIPQSDINLTFDVDIDGTLTSHDLVIRPSNADSVSTTSGWAIIASIHNDTASFNCYNGNIQTPIDFSPSGSSSEATSRSLQTYSANSYEKFVTVIWDLGDGNLSGGVSAFKWKVGPGTWQMSIDPPLDKDSTKELTLEVGYSWAREGEL